MRTRVGYTGGTELSPTYREMGSHTEAIQVVYDPNVVDYATLLQTFWDKHLPVNEPWSRQYRSAIFVTGPEERAAADASLDSRSKELGRKLYTAIEPSLVFWPAEDYHQKYRLRRQKPVVAALEKRFGDRWIDTTEAARLNALFGGYGLTGSLETLALSGDALEAVQKQL